MNSHNIRKDLSLDRSFVVMNFNVFEDIFYKLHILKYKSLWVDIFIWNNDKTIDLQVYQILGAAVENLLNY